jgi:beta-glucanase (GH16 family)
MDSPLTFISMAQSFPLRIHRYCFFLHTLQFIFRVASLWILLPLSGQAQWNFGQGCNGGKLFVPIHDTDFADQSEWQLLLFDDFDQESLDLSVWRNSYEQGSLGNHDNSSYLTLENVILQDGKVKLYAKRERIQRLAISYLDSSEILSDGLPNLRWFNYTSSLIRTFQTFRFGFFEASCKIPKGMGLWPAMWMYGSYGENNHDPNTIPSEIDVFEFWKNNAHNLNTNIHVGPEDCLLDFNLEDFSEEFHTFGMAWEPHKIEWFVDGQKIRTYHRFFQSGKVVGSRLNAWQVYEEAPFPNFPLLLYFDLYIDHHAGFFPNESTPFPSALEVDWVKFYARKNLIHIPAPTRWVSRVFPSPARDVIEVEVTCPDPMEMDAHIYDAMGTLWMRRKWTTSSPKIPVAGLPSGLYFINLFHPSSGFQSQTRFFKTE